MKCHVNACTVDPKIDFFTHFGIIFGSGFQIRKTENDVNLISPSLIMPNKILELSSDGG